MAPDQDRPQRTHRERVVPGVYIEEIPAGPGVRIAPLPTAVVAFVGEAGSGPVGEPVTVTGAGDYHARFGPSLDASRPMGHAVDLFFANGGSSAIVVRAEGPEPARAVPALEGTGFTVLVVPGMTTQHTDQVRVALERCAAYSAVLLLDLPDGPWIAEQHDLEAVAEHQERAALYHPWVVVHGTRLPPTGAVAGVLARTDREHGVWKAPGGAAAPVLGVDGLAEEVDQEVGDAMTTAGVNALRDLGDRGVLVWGARTLAGATTAEPHHRYLPMRRLLDYVARSVGAALGAVAFERNDAGLWARVRLAVEDFLSEQWRQGALQGAKPEEAYYVRCGRGQTMTDADLAAGRLVVEWGLAATRPAEFVVMRLSLATGTVAHEALTQPRDLGPVVSKYLGETEKNLSRVFRAADLTDDALLFDEADALFGKRTEVRDAHDRFVTRHDTIRRDTTRRDTTRRDTTRES